MRTHELKLDTNFFDVVLNGEKSFEVRNNGRGFQKGDKVLFKETEAGNHFVYHREATATITYVLNGWGIESGYVVFGIANVKEVENE